jgi:hypothetical protein
MIAEAPASDCDSSATSTRRRQMRVARRPCPALRASPRHGVAFFDFDHGQTGVASNAIELHPILHFECLSS